MYFNHQRMLQQQQQQRQQRLARQRWQQHERLRLESLERAKPPKEPTPFQRQSTARTVHPIGPVPKDAWLNLVGGKGYFDPAGWMANTYGIEQMNAWRQVWLTTTEDGAVVLARLVEKAAQKAKAQEALEQRRKQQQVDCQLQRELQERYRLPNNSVVRIKAPRTEDDGRLARLLGMQMVGNVLWADVLIDPCPPGHPAAAVSPRNRRVEHALYTIRLKAECLTREHPEALG